MTEWAAAAGPPRAKRHGFGPARREAGDALATVCHSFRPGRRVRPARASAAGEQPYWHKYSMYGAIAEAGVNAVELASLGFPSYPRILDRGQEIRRPLVHRRTFLKPYRFCRHGHGVIDRFRHIVLEHDLSPDDVDEVQISIAPYALLERIVEAPGPTTRAR
jgi:2-methylcitrate dehydratase PrpD